MDKLILLDAYAMIYRMYYAFIRNPRFNSKGENTSAIFGFMMALKDVIEKEQPTHVGVGFDVSSKTFRHEAYPEYKATREETPEAIRFAIPYIKSILRAYNIPVLEKAGYEADDIIGTLATKASKKDILTLMVTPDKDYFQLVGKNVIVYRPRNKETGYDMLGVKEVNEKYGIESPLQVIDLLGLMGDTADNVPGCPGVGEKTAVKLINEFGSIEGMFDGIGKLKGKLKENVIANREKILFSKWLVTIKTDVPIDLDMELLRRKEGNYEEMRKVLEEVELLKSADFLLLSDMLKQRTELAAQTKPTGTSQATHEETPASSVRKTTKSAEDDLFAGDLFAENPTEGQVVFENQNLATYETIPHDYKLIDNEELAKKLVEYLFTFDFLSLDTETTNVEAMRAKLVGMSFAVKEHEAFYVAVPQDQEEAQKIVNIFKPLYEDSKITKIGQNIKYDMLVLSKYGVEVQGPIFDTMIAHYILKPELYHNMDYLAETYLKYKTIHIEELIGERGKKQKNMADLLPSQIYEYASEDADITLQLKNILEKELEKADMTELAYNIEMPLIPVLVSMEKTGVRIDTNGLNEVAKQYKEKLHNLEVEVCELAGESFNIASPKQVGHILFEKLKLSTKQKKTKSGSYSTSESVLEEIKSKHPIVGKILTFRKLSKLLGTYITALPELINPETGHIHTSFNQAVTATGRLSSSNPNLQNIPIREDEGKEIRKAFIPDEGCLFFSADYSQIELRVMAHLSEDVNMIEAFRSDSDIHAATAAKVFKKNIEEVTRSERSKAKTANFGIIYGISAFGLAERMDVKRSEAKELIDEYFITYPKVKEYMDKSIAVAREKGYTETIFKRRCYLPDILSHNATVRGYAERNAINSPIQGSAADLVKIAMIRIYRRFQEEGLRSQMIIQVHDELNFNVYPEEKERVQQIVIEEMEHACKMHVPLKADYGWGANWLEAH
jgi:DNA polymerase-1